VVPGRRALPHNLLGFVDLETRLLEMLNHAGGELPAGIVRRVLRQEPAQQRTTARDREADRECQLVTKGAVIPPSAPLTPQLCGIASESRLLSEI
jgi:hypothetical protein